MPHTDVASAPVRTTLVHRVHRGPLPWWHSAVICDVAGGIDGFLLDGVRVMALDLARMGINAIALRPASSDMVWDSATTLAPFIDAVHRVGLRVIVQLPGAQLPSSVEEVDPVDGVSTLMGRVRATLAAGADGIDLGVIAPPRPVVDEGGTELFAQLVQLLLAELGGDDSPILTAQSPVSDPSILRLQLTENWFHHLRDCVIEDVPWDSLALQQAVASSFDVRDPLGQVCAWSWSRIPRAAQAADVAGDLRPRPSGGVPETSWEHGADGWRRDAMGLFMLSLPGAMHVPLADVGARVHIDEGGTARRAWSADPTIELRHRLIAQALRIREERRMAAGSLATVSGLDWAHDGVGVHMVAGVLVVLNTSDRPVTVPGAHRLLVSSAGVEASVGSPFEVIPNSCAWFEVARVEQGVVNAYA